MPSLKDPEPLSVHTGTAPLNGFNKNNLVENLIQLVLKLTDEVQDLRKHNESISSQVSKIVGPCHDSGR
jgi:hypothetical protein